MTRHRGALLLLAPYLIGGALLVVLPAALTFALSLTEYDLLTSPRFTGLENFGELIDDRILRTALLNSLLFLALAVPLRLVAAVGMALLLHRRARGRAAQRTAVYLPTVVPDVAFALLFLFLLNPVYGPVNALLGGLGLPQPEWLSTPAGAMASVVIIAAFTVGEGFVVALATRQELPEELYDLARLEGSRTGHTLRRVTLPLMRPTLALLAFRDTAFALQVSFVPALIVTGTGPDRATLFLPQFIYDAAFEELRYGYAAAVTLTLFALTALIVAAQARVLRAGRFGLGR
ncbi:MAG: sugar ABC transporter permease [Actinomycetota bacterium]|nr:sugar ABC transporter permease [Actinomycetota bacterium]